MKKEELIKLLNPNVLKENDRIILKGNVPHELRNQEGKIIKVNIPDGIKEYYYSYMIELDNKEVFELYKNHFFIYGEILLKNE